MKGKLFFIFLVGFILLFISGCAKKQCEKTSDCASQLCKTASCTDNECVYKTKSDCCGNNLKEAIEDGKKGSACTCEKDYGKCSGTNGTYVEKHCDANNECVAWVPPEKIESIKSLAEKKPSNSYFVADITTEYDSPFVVNKSKFVVSIRLKEDSVKLIYPVKLINFKVMEGTNIIGEKSADLKLIKLDDVVSIEIPVQIRTRTIEEKKTIKTRIEYEYSYIDGESQKTDRNYFEVSYTDKLIFVNPGLVK